MPELSLQNIDQISQDVRKQEITFSHLIDELTDHVCCDVENEMQKGLDFTEAYHVVKQKIGSRRRLQEIQEETLYAVDTKYRQMKNTMKISGILGTVLFGFATLFKIQHWPGAGIGMTLGGVILTFIFLPSSLVVLWKETKNRKRIFLFFSAFIAGACFIFGTLFKIQHWPGAGLTLILAVVIGLLFFMPALLAIILQDRDNKSMRPVLILAVIGTTLYVTGLLFKVMHWPIASLMMVIGVISLGFIVLPWYTWLKWKEESHISPEFLYIIIGALLLVVPGALINLNLQKGYETPFYSIMDKQQVVYNYLYHNNEALMNQYHDSAGFPKMEQIHSRTRELIAFISDMQASMVRESEGKPGNPAVRTDKLKQTETGLEIKYNRLSNAFHIASVKDFLLLNSKNRQNLDALVKDYMGYLSDMAEGDDLKKMIASLETSRHLPGETNAGVVYSLMPALHSLELFKNSILAVESCMLKSVANR
jgi:uncharacterized protein with PQ loop repeat